ncbi:MAG: DUF4197 domain-containing protein [Bacteroidales bacterium]
MKKIVLLTASLIALFSIGVEAQSLQSILESLTGSSSSEETTTNSSSSSSTTTPTSTGTSSSSSSSSILSSLTQSQASDGIREALIQGVVEGVGLVSKKNGYYGDALIKIGFPEELQKVESTLRAVGMDKVVDKGVQVLNRAAEDAASAATDIFVSAIKEMTLQDAIGLVTGGDNAATEYLKSHTSAKLIEKLSPSIETSLDKVNATKYWSNIITKYNAMPFAQEQVEPDLTKYVAEKAVDGLFVKIADEEKQIREDPVSRTSDILKSVFGN